MPVTPSNPRIKSIILLLFVVWLSHSHRSALPTTTASSDEHVAFVDDGTCDSNYDASLQQQQEQQQQVPTSFFTWNDQALTLYPSVPMKSEYLHYNFAHANEILPSLPSEITPPPFVRIYDFDKAAGNNNNNNNKTRHEMIVEMAREFQALTNEYLVQHGALIFRNLPLSAAEFTRVFWPAVDWPYYRRIDPFFARFQEEGMDLAPRAHPQNLVGVHNEQTYNPMAPKRVIFYALDHAWQGGESLFLSNHVLTDYLQEAGVMDWLKHEAGGYLEYKEWILYDSDKTNDPDEQAKSWQIKTNKTTRDEAIQVLLDYGFNRSGIEIDETMGTMYLTNNHTNVFVDEQHNNKLLWLDSITFDKARMAKNGELIPWHIYQKVELAEWKSMHALKLKKGDLLVLDNFRVAHGRLPYKDLPMRPRRLLTSYTF